MDLQLEEFRKEVRCWLEEKCPPTMRTPMPIDQAVWGGRKEKFVNPDARTWLKEVAEKGWLAPTWPVIYGGAGLSHQQAKIIQKEMYALQCRPPLMSLGIHMMGPTIMEYGTEEQKIKYLPAIARGEIRWCQGYSEPNAGSDLASLRCRAELEGGVYRVNGQKIWTSFADKSDFLFCLVRTDFDAAKHDGISVLLIDMESAGVVTKPIELISGTSHFCEVFLDDVLVPRENLLGQLNRGWDIAKRMLQHERNMMGQRDLGDPYNPALDEYAKKYIGVENGRIADGELRADVVRNQMQMKAIEITTSRVMQEIRAGGDASASSILKSVMSLAYQDKFEIMLSIMGSKSLCWQDQENFDAEELRAAKEWAFSKIQTIGGGTTEIQLNIIAKRILNLPD